MSAYSVLADLILALHVAFVVFVVIGLVLIWIGHFARWRWVRNLRFRVVHLVAILIVVAQAWIGAICPLTTLEQSLRLRGGFDAYSGSFITYWLRRLIFFDAEPIVFTVGYTLFAGLVIGSWWISKPLRREAK
jgi:hypothetical protein